MYDFLCFVSCIVNEFKNLFKGGSAPGKQNLGVACPLGMCNSTFFSPASYSLAVNPFTLKFHCARYGKQTAPHESTAHKLSFEWSH